MVKKFQSQKIIDLQSSIFVKLECSKNAVNVKKWTSWVQIFLPSYEYGENKKG